METMVWGQVKHLYKMEKLGIREIAEQLGKGKQVMRSYPDSILQPYECLINQWYQEYSFLNASGLWTAQKL